MQPIMIDYDKIWEAVYNIMDNAIKYSKVGGSVKVTTSASDNMLILEVADSGTGIPDEYKERVFERFYRLDDSRARETGGTGLGLSIVHQMVLMHGGTVSVDSEEGSGSTFTVELPIHQG